MLCAGCCFLDCYFFFFRSSLFDSYETCIEKCLKENWNDYFELYFSNQGDFIYDLYWTLDEKTDYKLHKKNRPFFALMQPRMFLILFWKHTFTRSCTHTLTHTHRAIGQRNSLRLPSSGIKCMQTHTNMITCIVYTLQKII